MSNRFTDTDKWKKGWFRKLPPNLKCFWIYICDNCNHAGIWDVDFELASFIIGEEIDQEKIMEILKNKIVILNGNKKWFIPGFIEFQYRGDLNPNNKCHSSVINILKKEGAYKGLTRPLQGYKEKETAIETAIEIEKDKEKDKDKDKSRREYLLAGHLAKWILRNNSSYRELQKDKIKATIKRWVKDFDLMIRIDKRSYHEILEVIEWCQQDDFWIPNILSAGTLRKKYDKLTMQMNRKVQKHSGLKKFLED